MQKDKKSNKEQKGSSKQSLSSSSKSIGLKQNSSNQSSKNVSQKQVVGQQVQKSIVKNEIKNSQPQQNQISKSQKQKQEVKKDTSAKPQLKQIKSVPITNKINLSSLDRYGIQIIPFQSLKLNNQIGSGGFGKVYASVYAKNQVAVKVLDFEQNLDESQKEIAIQDFIKEIQAMISVQHERFIRLIGLSFDEHFCLINELASNGSLSSYIEKNDLQSTEILRILIQICEGMSYIHSLNPPIAHRDLKPQNILLDHQLNVKICDLGLSRSLQQSESQYFKLGSQTCIVAGTIRYMAPELYDAKPLCTTATDV